MHINGKVFRTIWFEDNIVKIIDQTKLPHKFIIKDLRNIKDAVNAIKTINPSYSSVVVSGNTEDELVIDWQGNAEISVADIKAKITEMETAETNEATAKEDLKASAKTKLIAGEPLTEEEANVMIGG